MAKYLLAHDLGTSGDKATIFREDGKLIKSIIREYPTKYSGHGFVEQSPDDWWRAVCETTQEMLTLVDKNEVAAVSFGGQQMGVLCVDKNGTPLRDSIIWADTRSAREAKVIDDNYGRDRFYETTGHRLSPSHSITKLMWVRDNQPDIYKNTYKTLNSKDYIVLKFTGVFATDYSDASGTLAYDVHKKTWAADVMEAAGVDIEKFPDIKSGMQVVGYVTKEAAEATGLKQGMPVVLGGGDGCMCRIGAGCAKEGAYNINLGTSAVNGYVSSRPILDRLQRTVSWCHVDDRFVNICGTMQACGASIAWMKNNLCYEEQALAKETGESYYKFINENAAKSPVGANGLMFLPYLHGERAPHWNADAKGVFLGLTMKHTINDMKRAVFEGVALNMGLIHNIIKENVGEEGLPKQIMISGGAAKSPIVLQSMADIYNADMIITDMADESGSLGAAIVAGYGIGLYPNILVADQFQNVVKVTKPIKENVEFFRERIKVFQDAYTSLIDIYPKLG